MTRKSKKSSSNSERSEEHSAPTGCTSFFKHHRGYPINRKAIDTSGGLGSLYDYGADRLIDHHSAKTCINKAPPKRYICEIYQGYSNMSLNDLLRRLDFDESIQRNIRLGNIEPLGISLISKYDKPINQYTRFLYYSYCARKIKLNVKARKGHKLIGPPQHLTDATHMITKIIVGMEILVVMQVPSQNVENFDNLLRYICNHLRRGNISIQFNNDALQLINQLTNVAVFGSETCMNDRNMSIPVLLDKLQIWGSQKQFHKPLLYTMQPLRWVYGGTQFNRSCHDISGSNDPYIKRAENEIKRVQAEMKNLNDIFIHFNRPFSSPTLKHKLNDYQQHYQFLLNSQQNLEERLHVGIADVIRGEKNSKILNDIVNDQRYHCLNKNEIDEFNANIKRLFRKLTLIENLKENRVEYINALDLCTDKTVPATLEHVDDCLKRMYSSKSQPAVLWFSSDRLQREQEEKWKQIFREITSEKSQARIIYADFTYFQKRLEDFMIVNLPSQKTQSTPGNEFQDHRSRPLPPDVSKQPLLDHYSNISQKPNGNLSSDSVSPRPSNPTIPSAKESNKTEKIDLNVLLLGETGVGKSTFINAFVNYLKFETLELAERGEPVVLIPVSFMLTVGNQFDEFIVKFGNPDANENHENDGQSVTQQCQSYIFNLNSKYRLRIIDSPGIGDTRGINQDDINMRHILQYINNLPHLNAVCLLLKPNSSRLNVLFRSCIRQLTTYITPIGYENIIFCFTNARSTFFAPGDTGPLLRKMLADENLNDIPFKKQNTYCFDSESFRYLAARKRGIKFDDFQKKECYDSWNVSVKESIRLISFIQERQPYDLQNWLSVGKALIDINLIAQPVMETLRLIVYNWKLTEARFLLNQLIIKSNVIDTEICTHCAQTNISEIGPFWIVQYQQNVLNNNVSEHHRCPAHDKCVPIEALIKHEFINRPAGLKNERWQSSFHNLILKCDKLAYFMRQQGPIAHIDPFEQMLQRFLEEEQKISKIRNIDLNMNRRVYDILQTITQIRQQSAQQLFQNKEKVSLKQVYEIIDDLIAIPTVQKLFDTTKTSRRLILEAHEHKISPTVAINLKFS